MALRRIAESRNRQRGKDEVLQEFGTVYPVPIGLGENVRGASANALITSIRRVSACRHPAMPADSRHYLDQRFEIDLRKFHSRAEV